MKYPVSIHIILSILSSIAKQMETTSCLESSDNNASNMSESSSGQMREESGLLLLRDDDDDDNNSNSNNENNSDDENGIGVVDEDQNLSEFIMENETERDDADDDDDEEDDHLEINNQESDEADSSVQVEQEQDRSESQDSSSNNNNSSNNSSTTIPRHVQMQIVQRLQQRYDLPHGSSIVLTRQAGTGMIQARILPPQQQQQSQPIPSMNQNGDPHDTSENSEQQLSSSSSSSHRSVVEMEVSQQSNSSSSLPEQQQSQQQQQTNSTNGRLPPIRPFHHGSSRGDIRMRSTHSSRGRAGERVRVSLSPRISLSSRSSLFHPPPPLPQAVRLSPLRPLVLADSQQNFQHTENTNSTSTGTAAAASADTEHHDDDDLERFHCSICYEYLIKPASCGSCPSRFCLACLEKVFHATTTPSSLSSAAAAAAPKLCPTCRNPLTKIHPDRSLWNEMKAYPKIPCRFEGCPAMLSLVGVRHHENAHCPRVQVACRYQPFGCPWKGFRGDMFEHEETECALHKVSALVQEHRVLREQWQRTTTDMNRRIHGLAQMVEYQRIALQQQQVQVHHRTSPSNPLQLLSFIVSVLCVPGWVVQHKDLWSDMWRTAEARAAVCNFCTLCPTLLLAGRLLLNEYSTVMNILHSPSFSIWKTDQSSTRLESFIDAVFTFMAMFLIIVLFIVCFTVDNKSSREWQTYQVPRTKWQGRYILHIVAVAFGLMYNLMFDIAGDIYTAAFLFVILLIATSLLSNVMVAFSLQLAGATGVTNNERSAVECGRAVIPLMFGLKYGFLFYMLDPVPCVGVVPILYASESTFKLVSVTLHHKEPFFSNFDRLGFIACFVAAVSFDVHSVMYNGGKSSYLDWFLSISLLLVLNLMLSRFSEFFTVVGHYLHRSAVATLQRNTQQNPVVVGSMILALLSCCLSILAVFST